LAIKIDRSFLKRLLVTTALPLVLLAERAGGAHAQCVPGPGSDIQQGANGADGGLNEPGGAGLAFAFAASGLP
jgi:hypothetical protein